MNRRASMLLVLFLSCALSAFSQERETAGATPTLNAAPASSHGCQMTSNPAHTQLRLQVERQSSGGISGWTLAAKINGQDIRLQVDTGASGILISPRAASKANVTRIGDATFEGLGDKYSKGYWGLAQRVQIGGVEFKDCVVAVAGTKANRGDGLVGTVLFADFLITLDLPGKTLSLAPLPKLEPEGGTSSSLPSQPPVEPEENRTQNSKRKGQGAIHATHIPPDPQSWTPVQRLGSILLIPVSLNNRPAEPFVIDTGAAASVISPRAAQGLSTQTRPDHFRFVYGVNGEIQKLSWAKDVTLRFARFEQDKKWIPVFDLSKISKAIGTEVSGLLGMDSLGQLVLSIDYRDRLVDFHYDPKRLGSEWKK